MFFKYESGFIYGMLSNWLKLLYYVVVKVFFDNCYFFKSKGGEKGVIQEFQLNETCDLFRYCKYKMSFKLIVYNK